MASRKVVYCHFSFRRPRGRGTGIFSAALYTDIEGKCLVDVKVREKQLWENHQHITAIQAYENALRCIWEWQPVLIEHGVTNVLLVTDNSVLAGWIEDTRKNREYYNYMNKANSQYRVGAIRELVIGVGLCEPRKAEKSYKYCKDELVTERESVKRVGKALEHQVNKLSLDGMDYASVLDILDKANPTLDGNMRLMD